MKPEELIDQIINGDVKTLANSLVKLNDATRKKLSKTASQLSRGLEDSLWQHRQNSSGAKAAVKQLEAREIPAKDMDDRLRLARATGEIAVLACCPLSTIKNARISLRTNQFDDKSDFLDAALEILKSRGKDFNNQLVRQLLTADSDGSRLIEWPLIVDLMRAGACDKPDGDDYIYEMAQSVGHRQYYGDVKARGNLLSDLMDVPGFVESDVYRLFEYDSDAFAYDWTGWDRIIKQLIEAKQVDRSRIIGCVLSSMSNRCRLNTSLGLIKLMDRLEVQPAEIAANLTLIWGLLGSPVSPVLNYTLKRIKELNRDGLVDPETLLAHLPAAFQSPTKGSAKTALTLIQQVARKHSNLVPLAINSALVALSHQEADINEKALDFVEKWSDRAHPDHAAAIRDKLDSLSPVVAKRAKSLANSIVGTASAEDVEATVADSDEGEANSIDRSEIGKAACEIVEPWRTLAGIDSVISSFDNKHFPPTLEVAIHEVPVLSALEPVVPIGDHAELIDAIAQALEVVQDSMDVERILDGISRLGKISDEYQEAAQPVAMRVHAQPSSETSRGLTTSGDSENTVTILELLFDIQEPDRKDDWRFMFQPKDRTCPDTAWYRKRIEELCESIEEGTHCGLLSMPTHQRGWIDPCEFATRLAGRIKAKLPIQEGDFVLALLRLAPDHRSDALKLLPRSNSEWNRLGRLVLGADVKRLGDLSDCAPGALNAAALVRSTPIGVEFGEQWGLGKKVSSGEPVVQMQHVERDLGTEKEIRVARTKPFNSHPVLQPLFDFGKFEAYSYTRWRSQMNAWTSKHECEPYLAFAVAKVLAGIDENPKVSEPLDAFFEILFEPDQVWTESMHLLASLGCLVKNQDVRIQTMDALIEAALDGRADPRQLGGRLAVATQHKIGNLKRLATAFDELGRVSPLHRWFVVEAIDPLVSSFEKPPNGAGDIFDVFLNGLIELELVASEQAVKTLGGIKGSSKAAKVAKKILALELKSNSSKRREAKSLVLDARIELGTRWQSSP